MRKQLPIQIIIPKPCSQSWDEMSVNGHGRYCGHCSKTVIDFTTWTDADLHKFFSKNTGQVCGRFFDTQLERSISIPYQPHSRLYRMAIAMGLTLLFTQIPQGNAQKYAPVVSQSPVNANTTQQTDTGVLRGRILDDKKEPLPSAAIEVFQNNVVKGGAIADSNGNYVINDLQSGAYDVIVLYAGYDTIKKNITLTKDISYLDMVFSMARRRIGEMRVIKNTKPLIDLDNPDKTILTRDDIERTPH